MRTTIMQHTSILVALLFTGCHGDLGGMPLECPTAIIDGQTILTGDIVLAEPSRIVFDAPLFFDATCTGPQSVDREKWGPSAELPFAWPGRAEQLAPTNPSDPREHLIYESHVPPEARLESVSTWLFPSVGHSDIPAKRPTVAVWKYSAGLGTSELLGDATIQTTTLAQYEQRTQLTIKLDNATVHSGERVFVDVSGEYSFDSVVGLVVDTPTYLFSTSAMTMP